jgi:hypothetical protein
MSSSKVLSYLPYVFNYNVDRFAADKTDIRTIKSKVEKPGLHLIENILNVILLDVVLSNVVLLNAIFPNVILLSAIFLMPFF